MPCDELKIHLYVDGELSPGEQRDCRAHLKECSSCRRVQRELVWLDGALRGVQPRRTTRPWLFASALAASLLVGWLWWGIGSSVDGEHYHIELAGGQHEVSVRGGELLELAVGEDKPEPINLERARIR